MIRSLILTLCLLGVYSQSSAFCGFYVAPAGASLTNKSSQVIIVRDGNHTVITMANDFKGSVKDFAMVVPVPEILAESDIRVVQQSVFGKLNDYTAPRMSEYYDPQPCQVAYPSSRLAKSGTMRNRTTAMDNFDMEEEAKELGVTVEAQYTVGEYDILILSATESSGLKTWLKQNNYELPSGAEEVLQPYINDGMKFFVVKVNLEEQAKGAFTQLRPLQIQFNSSRFMLPIRLGMANAKSTQDLIVYALTRSGRVESVNYRTTKIPTDRDVPQFIKTKQMFGEFYEAVFEKAWKQEGRNSVMLEYAWDISSQQPVKCDPCATPPIYFNEMREAGVWWINPDGYNGYQGDLFVTRLHVRYGRDKFPQDLMFMATPNKEHFQGRYVIHNPATGPMDCEAGKEYLKTLKMRKGRELDELVALTGWSPFKYGWYLGNAGEPAKTLPEPALPESPTTSPVMVKSDPQGTASLDPVAGEVIPETVAGQAEDKPVTETAGLSGEALETSTDEFLSVARAEAGESMPSNRWMLFGIAMVMLAGGLVYRRISPAKPRS